MNIYLVQTSHPNEQWTWLTPLYHAHHATQHPCVSKWKWIPLSKRRRLKHSEMSIDCNLNLSIDLCSRCCRLSEADFWRECTVYLFFWSVFVVVVRFFLEWKLNKTLNNINLRSNRRQKGGKMHCIHLVSRFQNNNFLRWFLSFLLQSVSLQTLLFSLSNFMFSN